MYSATPLTQTPKGNKKLWELNVVCVLLIIHLRNPVFTFPAQSTVIFIHLDCFRRVFFMSCLVKLYIFHFHECHHVQRCSDNLTL